MSRKHILALAVACLLAPHAHAAAPLMGQTVPPRETVDDVSPVDRAKIQAGIAAFSAHGSTGSPGTLADVIKPYPIVPIAGNLWDDVFTNNFVDLDTSAGSVKDWDCTGWTYDGHQGHDIDLRGFPYMDIGVPVFAVLDGTVIDAHDGEFDRIIGSIGTIPTDSLANYLVINHGGTQDSIYYHLRKGSVTVNVGDTVKAGQQIGLVGSSGYSGAPHLHFESQDAGAVFEPSAGPCRPGTSDWVTQPTIDRDFFLGELNVSDAFLDNYYDGNWGWPREGTFTKGPHRITLWFSPHNMPVNSTYQLHFTEPDGTVYYDTPTWPFSNTVQYRDLAYYWVALDIDMEQIGAWHVAMTINNQTWTAPFEVVQDVHHIVNRPPNVITAAFDPPSPTVHDVIFCRITSPLLFTDPDYDIVRYHYVWTVNGATVRDVTHAGRADAIPHDSGASGATVKCVVTPSDGTLNGTPVTVTSTLTASLAGDVDNNGQLTQADVSLALQIAGGKVAGDSGEVSRGHIAGSGPLTIIDAARIMRRIVGL